ncbi:MAG TPA: nitroreductase family deazaflavin-dependent oxidoreductase [Candidatus Limnocylindrales bacterium]|nr:nitroreductase family deazaflavin-dependent oxidoreductase [Candidatus Limnocylindrales bacterium]
MTTPTTPELANAIQRVLRHGHTIDITTTGRVTGEPRRIEIVFFNFGGRLYICGTPNPNHERAWLRNLRANPRFTFHLKALLQADLPATAQEVTDSAERRRIIELVARAWRRTDIDAMVEHSPLVEVTLDGIEPAAADTPD